VYGKGKTCSEWRAVEASPRAKQCRLTQWQISRRSLIQKWWEQLTWIKTEKLLRTHTSLSILWLVWLIWWWARAGKISARLLVKVHLHCQMPVALACYSCVPGSCGLGSCVKPQQHWHHDTCGMACGSDVLPMSAPAISPLKNVRISINRSDNHLHQW